MDADGRWTQALYPFGDGALVTAVAFAEAETPGELFVVLLLIASAGLASANASGGVQLP